MSDVLLEGLKVGGLMLLLLPMSLLVYGVMLGIFRAVSGEADRQKAKVSRAWLEGWNAAMRGQEADQAEWVRRIDEEMER